jgi:light-independent protochlorophyllide reductase B subunit
MEPLKTCKLFGAIRAVLGIKNAIPIIHGPLGCSYHTQYLLSLRSARNIRILTTAMEQEDVVFGAEDKLEAVIRKADKNYNPSLIAILTSCASSIIGEDVERVVKTVNDHVKAKVLVINAGGFEGNQTDGYRDCLLALIDLMENPNSREPSLNLVAQFRGGPDLETLKNYFNKLEIPLNCVLTSGSTLKQINNASNASLNVSMCEASGLVPCQIMEKKFQIPFLHPNLPIGINATSNFFRSICKVLCLEYGIAHIEERYRKIISSYFPFLAGKKVAIVAGSTRAIPLTEFMLELGMKPVLICLDLLGQHTNKKINEVVKNNHIKPTILKEADYQDIHDQMVILRPELILGGMHEFNLSRELEIPLLDVMHGQELTIGFEGAVAMAENIKKILKH